MSQFETSYLDLRENTLPIVFFVYSNSRCHLTNFLKECFSCHSSANTAFHASTLHLTGCPSAPSPLHQKTECLMSKNDGGRIYGNQILTRGSLAFSLSVFNKSLFNNFYKRSGLHLPQMLNVKLHSVKNLIFSKPWRSSCPH